MATNNQAPAVSTEKQDIRVLLQSDKVKNAITAVVGKSMSPDRLCRLMVTAVNKSPLLAKCDQMSVLGAFMAAASLGLEPNTPLGHAYLIPYKKGGWGNIPESYECQFIIGYKGFVKIASDSGVNVIAGAIHENDYFEYMQGSESFLKYKINLSGERGPLIGAFAYSKFDNGTEVATVLPLSEIHKIRSKSETYAALVRNLANSKNDQERAKNQKKLDETPWVLWEDDMSIKSVIKKHAKALPLGSAKLAAAAELDSLQDGGAGINLASFASEKGANDLKDGVIDSYAETIPEHEDDDAPQGNQQQEQQQARTTKADDVLAGKGSTGSTRATNKNKQQPEQVAETTKPQTQPIQQNVLNNGDGDDSMPFADDDNDFSAR